MYPVYRSDPRHPIKVLMIAHLAHRNARSVPWAGKEALALIGEQDLTSHDIGPRTSKSSSPPEEPDNRIFRGYCRAKGIGDLGPFHIKPMAHFISSPWPMPRRKICPRTSKESPNCQDILPKTTLSSANWDHERGKCHATKGSLLECLKGEPKHSGPAIGAWWRSNPRKGCHFRIKYPQLTSWLHLCGCNL